MQEGMRMILSECEEINSVLCKPIIATQRIKYTCFGVSTSYIVLGSTSGSLYLFTREPCAFRQLIPLSEGAIRRVVVSPDERTVALATKSGVVCSVCIKPSIKLLGVSREHLGVTVTDLCWSGESSEIYVGDAVGKISTVVLSKFALVNGMFQAPSCALMHLDSAIVQMDYSDNLLLVSTLTRCYICDTAQEQFKHIGNKARDGVFGACFLKTGDGSDGGTEEKAGLGSCEEKGERDAAEMKIYCARPGFRLWEVTTSGTVVMTHQFRDALATIPSTRVYRCESIVEAAEPARQTCDIRESRPAVPAAVPATAAAEQQGETNFSHLFALCGGKYLLSNNRSSIFVIDPTSSSLLSWNSDYPNIGMLRTTGDRIYLMRENGVFHCLRLTTAERLILEFHERKNNRECLRACQLLKPELLLKSRAREDNEDRGSILPSAIVSLLRKSVGAKPTRWNAAAAAAAAAAVAGIVVVNSGSGSATLVPDDNRLREAVDAAAESEDTALTVDTVESEGTASRALLSVVGDEEPIVAIIRTRLKSVCALIESIGQSLTSRETEDVITGVRKRMSEMSENFGKMLGDGKTRDGLREVLRSTERRYYEVLLGYCAGRGRDSLASSKEESVVDEIARAFVDTNVSYVDECCACGYEFPSERPPREPRYSQIGRCLLERYSAEDKRERCAKLCNSVGYMWRYYLPMTIVNRTVADDTLRMCLRTRDKVVLSILLPIIDVRQWEIAVRWIKRMEIGQCPCCERRNERLADNNVVIDWSGVAREIMKRDGTSAAVTFLTLIETVLPDVRLDKSIFRSVIFTKILNHYGIDKSVDFDRNDGIEHSAVCSQKVADKLSESVERDVERAIRTKEAFGCCGPHHWGLTFRPKSSTCPCCTLSLDTPVLLGEHGISIFPCGHVYHVSCLIQNKLSKCCSSLH